VRFPRRFAALGLIDINFLTESEDRAEGGEVMKIETAKPALPQSATTKGQ
jgi:hypothetical protein